MKTHKNCNPVQKTPTIIILVQMSLSLTILFIEDNMGSLGASKTSIYDPFNGALGDRNIEPPLDRLQYLMDEKIINDPDDESGDYRRNCALCATAVPLQLMGYDVEAMPRDKKMWRGFNSVFEVDYSNPDNYMLSGSSWSHTGYPTVRNGQIRYYPEDEKGNVSKAVTVDNPPRAPRGTKAVVNAIEEKVKGWGNGAYGQMSVSWKDTSTSHSVNIFNKNGQVMVYDPQINQSWSLVRYMNRPNHPITAIQTEMVRLDNAKIKANIKDLDKIVRKSRGSKRKSQNIELDSITAEQLRNAFRF